MPDQRATRTQQELIDLRKVARRLARGEEALTQLRAQRDMLIYKACQAGASERAAADAAGVSPTYAHRCKADKGNPRSGPIMDADRQTGNLTRMPPRRKRVAGVF